MQHIPEIPDDPIDDWIARNVYAPAEQLQAEAELRRSDRRGRWIVVLIAFLVLFGAWCATVDAQTAPIDYTTKGRIVLTCGGAEISQHVVETESTRPIIDYAMKNGGKATCTLTYPPKVVIVNLPVGACTQPPLPAATLSGVRRDNTVAGKHDVVLTWTVVPDAISYVIERCTGPTCTNFGQIDTSQRLTYTNNSLPGGFTFRYRVKAVNGARDALHSNTVSVATPTAPEPTPPVTGSTTLSWTPPTHNNDGSALTNLAGYKLYVSTQVDPPGAGNVIQISDPSSSSYSLTGLAAGTYTIRATAVTLAGAESPSSNTVTKVVP